MLAAASQGAGTAFMNDSNWHQRGLQILAVMLLPASNTRAQNTVIFPPLLPVGFNHIEPIQAIPVNFS